MQTKKKKEGAKGRAIYNQGVLKKNAVATRKQSQTNVRHIDKLKILSEIKNEGKKSILMEGIEKAKERASFLNKTADKNSMREKKNSSRDSSRGTVLKFSEPNRNKSLTDKEKKEHAYGRGPSKEDTHRRGRTTNTQVTHNSRRRTNERKTSSMGKLLLRDGIREEENLSSLLQGLSKERIGRSDEGGSSSKENARGSRGSARGSRGSMRGSGERGIKSYPWQAKSEDQKGAKGAKGAKVASIATIASNAKIGSNANDAKIAKIAKSATQEERVKEANAAHVKKLDGSAKNKSKKDHIVIDDSNIYIVIDDLNENLNDKAAIINKLNITNDTYNFLKNSKNEMRGGKRRNANYSLMGESHPVSGRGVDGETLQGADADADEEDGFYDEGEEEDDDEALDDEEEDGEEDDEEDDEEEEEEDYDFDNKSVSIRGIGEDSTNDELEDLEISKIYESFKTENLHPFEEAAEEEAKPEGAQGEGLIEETSKKKEGSGEAEGAVGSAKGQAEGQAEDQAKEQAKEQENDQAKEQAKDEPKDQTEDQSKGENLDKEAKNDQADAPELKEAKPLSTDTPEGDAPLLNKGNVETNDEGVGKSDEAANPNSFGGKRKISSMKWKEAQPQWEEALQGVDVGQQEGKSAQGVEMGNEENSNQMGQQWSEASVMHVVPVVPLLPVMHIMPGLQELGSLQEMHGLHEVGEKSEQEEPEGEKRKRRKKMEEKGKREKLKFSNERERREHKNDQLDRLYKQINKMDVAIPGEVAKKSEGGPQEGPHGGDPHKGDEFNYTQYSKIVKLLSISKDISKYNVSEDPTDDDRGGDFPNVGGAFKERAKHLDKADRGRSKQKAGLLPFQMENGQGSSSDKRGMKKTGVNDFRKRDDSAERKEEKKTKLKRKYSNEGVDSGLKTGPQGSQKSDSLKELSEGKEEDLMSGAHQPGGEPAKGIGMLSSKRKNEEEGEQENVSKRLKKGEGVGSADGEDGVNAADSVDAPGGDAPAGEQKDVSEEPAVVGEKGEKGEASEEVQTEVQPGQSVQSLQSGQPEDVDGKEAAEWIGDMAEEDAEVKAVLEEIIEQGTAAGEEDDEVEVEEGAAAVVEAVVEAITGEEEVEGGKHIGSEVAEGEKQIGCNVDEGEKPIGSEVAEGEKQNGCEVDEGEKEGETANALNEGEIVLVEEDAEEDVVELEEKEVYEEVEEEGDDIVEVGEEKGAPAGVTEEVLEVEGESEQKEVVEIEEEDGDGAAPNGGEVNIGREGKEGEEEEKAESDKFEEVAEEEVYEEVEEGKDEEYEEVEEVEGAEEMEEVKEVDVVNEADEVEVQESQKDAATEEVAKEDVPVTEGIHSELKSDSQEKEHNSKPIESANEIVVEDSSKEYDVADHGGNDNGSTNSDCTDLNASSRKEAREGAKGCELVEESSLQVLDELSGGEHVEMGAEGADQSVCRQVEKC
ncbi:conserved Plasmodium protein, unknown function [Plasmodium vivax]|nr:conserved Plasmodium protein, unknown function [Plasmodium vivax]